MSKDTISICPECAKPLPVGAPGGMCPRCMLKRFVRPGISVHSYDKAPDGTPLAPAGERILYFGDYELMEELARGGMGMVYKARQLSLNRVVALKMILSGQLATEQEVRRFRTEAEAAANLDHPNIVPLYEVGEHEGRQFFTMKLLEGGSLDKRIGAFAANHRLAAKTLAELGRAVHYAHRRGILHRDLKPANVLFDAQDIPYVSDFGLAKQVEDSATGATQTGAVIGTPAYMSPEQACGQSRTLTVASDIYSLGVILYEMLAGRVPFAGDSLLAVLEKVRLEEPPAPRTAARDIDRDLEVICLKCLRKEPEHRYATAEALAADLERWLRGEPILARPAALRERVYKWVKRRPAVALSAVLAFALAGAIAGSVWHNAGLKRRQEAQSLARRYRNAEEAVRKGAAALELARNAQEADSRLKCEQSLIEAQDNFRAGLFEISDFQPALDGLRDASLRHFQVALDGRVWPQAREKLKLAQSAGLARAEYTRHEALLEARQSEREGFIRKRVRELMEDAQETPRAIVHEAAAFELIALKDPLTAELLLPYIDHKWPDCRKLAIAVLAWYGEPRVIPKILPYIHARTPALTNNPQDVQEAAINAVCVLATDKNLEAYNTVHDRIWREPGQTSSLLAQRVRMYYEPLALRMASKAGEKLELKPDEQPASEWCKQGARYFDADQFTRAVSCYDNALEADPRYVSALVGRGVAHRAAGNLDAALADFDAAIEMEPKLALAYVNRGLVKFAKRDPRGAIADCTAALSFDSKNAQAYHLSGRVKFEMRDTDAAVADLSRAVELDPTLAAAYIDRSKCHAKKGDLTSALADSDKALELNSRDDAAYLHRCNLRMAKSDWVNALADAEKSLELNPSAAKAHAARGRIRQAMNNPRAAMTDCNRAVAIDSHYVNGYMIRASVKRDLGKFGSAIQDYNIALNLQPNDPVIYLQRALTRARKKDLTGAMDDFDHTLQLDQKYAEAYFYRGDFELNNGDRNGAMTDFKKALESTVRHEPSAPFLRTVREKLQQLEKAE